MKKTVLILILLTNLISGVSYSQTTFIPTGATTIYDLQSHGSPSHIVQDKNNPNYIHAVYTSSPYSDTTFVQRTVEYLLSTDKGETWRHINNVPLFETDFPAISLLSTGVPIISLNHTVGLEWKIISYVDVFPGLGSFTNLGTSSCGGAFPVMTAADNINRTNKFFILSSTGFSSSLSITLPSYSSCVSLPDIFGFSDKRCIAAGLNGKIGIAYISDFNPGDVYFMESTNNGDSFSSPYKIYDAVFNADKTFMGAYRGISLVYNNNIPNVVFEVVKQNATGYVFYGNPCGIMHWSPVLPGADPNRSSYIAKNDSASYNNYVPFFKAYGNDELTSLCRPSIGTFTDSNYLAVVYMAASGNTRITNKDSVRFNDIYISYSDNKGLSWKPPIKLNSNENPQDWVYPSISPFNYSTAASYYYANIVCTKDSIPGSYVNNPDLGRAIAKQQFIKAGISTGVSSDITTTRGTVKYNDNNQFVTDGIVKALRFDESTGQTVTTATAPIDENGNYILNFEAPYNTHYIVAYPNSEKNSDFVPTFYPNTIDWQSAVTVNSQMNNPNINIGVFRKQNVLGLYSLSGTVNKVQNNITSILPGTIVYLKSGDNFIGYTKSDNKGRYTVLNIPQGSYEITAAMLGFSVSSKIIPLNNSIDSVNFTVNQILNGPVLLPQKYILYQNYPNPFNPVTNIKFDIPKASYVKINVYNVLGKEVSLLMSENKSPGKYSINFNASPLTSGVYFYKIETDDFTETKRMVILK